MLIRPEILPHKVIDTHVDEVVFKEPPGRNLHREAIDLLGIFPVKGGRRHHLPLCQQVAKGAGHGLKPLPLGRLLRRHDVVEDQMAVVVIAAGKLKAPAFVQRQFVWLFRHRHACLRRDLGAGWQHKTHAAQLLQYRRENSSQVKQQL